MIEIAGAMGGWAWAATRLEALSSTDVAVAFAALALIRACHRLGMWPYALIALPGTLAHELAHYLTALLLFAKPAFPSLVPQRTSHGWRLGSVTFRAGIFRAVPIALAPLLLAPLALAWAAGLMAPASGAVYFLHAWVVGALVSACLPSSADFRIAVPALVVIGAVAGLLWLVAR
jgi:hypothetical protein